MVLTAVGYVQFAIVLAALGLVPRTPTPQTALAICVSKFIGTLGSYINGCAILGMWADCVEECEVRTGVRIEGFFMAAGGFAFKATQGAGVLIAGIMLAAVHFPVGQSVADVADDRVRALTYLFAPVNFAFQLLAAAALLLYPITRDAHERHLAELEDRRSAACPHQKGSEPERGRALLF